MPEVIKDKLGREIKPGSYVAYGHLMGRSAGLKIGKILKAKTVDPGPMWVEGTVGYRLRVQGVEDGWGDRPPVLSGVGTLQFPDRVIVVNADDIPEAYRQLLEPVAVEGG